jgi:hypothetical protein
MIKQAFHPPRSRPAVPVRAMALIVFALGVVLAGGSAQAATFGPNLETAKADYPYTCAFAGGYEGCTVEDPLVGDMETIMSDPVANGDQTGVVTAIHVKAAAEMQAQFVVVEWSGIPGAGEPFPSGVMAVSEEVTLHEGISDFSTNLPVDRRFLTNGYETWSQLALTILDSGALIPVESGGAFALTGTISDNWLPLTQTVEDLTVPPHETYVGGLPSGTLLMSGEVTITTPKQGEQAQEEGTGAPQSAAGTAPLLAFPKSFGRLGRGRATVPLRCVGPANCAGRITLRNRAPRGATIASKRKRSRKAKTHIYATGSFSISAGKTSKVTLKLTKAGKAAIGSHRSVRVYVTTTLTGGKDSTRRITLKRSHTRKRSRRAS